MRQNVELVAACACIVQLTVLYAAIAGSGPPGPGTVLGHWIGIVGFALMLMTEVLYSLRKQSRHIRWGPMQTWLSAHIFTGIVGPYMVFLHTGFQFAGLAGLTMWLTRSWPSQNTPEILRRGCSTTPGTRARGRSGRTPTPAVHHTSGDGR